MANLQTDMVKVLTELRTNHGVTAVRGEFEAEGARPEELQWLANFGRQAGLGLCIKTGGPEAVTDLMMARDLGATSLIAPMVESAYALGKAASAYARVYPQSEWSQTPFHFNIETIGAYRALDEIIALAARLPQVRGVVFGRVDFGGSQGLPRSALENKPVMAAVHKVAGACKHHSLDFALGGGIGPESVVNLRDVHQTHLSRYETRKIVFDPTALQIEMPEAGLALAAEFELLWLQHKRAHYQSIAVEDEKRINLLEQRLQVKTLDSNLA